MSSSSRRHSAMAMILGPAAAAAILLATAPARAENIPFDLSLVHCYAFAYAVGIGEDGEVADGPYDTGDVTYPVSVSAHARCLRRGNGHLRPKRWQYSAYNIRQRRNRAGEGRSAGHWFNGFQLQPNPQWAYPGPRCGIPLLERRVLAWGPDADGWGLQHRLSHKLHDRGD